MLRLSQNECTKRELDLFEVPGTQSSILEGVNDDIHPFSNFQNSTIEFNIQPVANKYLVLNDMELYLVVSLKKIGNNGVSTHVSKEDSIGLVNNIADSLFSQVEVFINLVNVENSNTLYAYKCYMLRFLLAQYLS